MSNAILKVLHDNARLIEESSFKETVARDVFASGSDVLHVIHVQCTYCTVSISSGKQT